MIKDNFYILSGGPGGGKTSLLEYLASMGFNFIPETAREIIRERLSKGLSPRQDAATFAKEMFLKDYNNYMSNLHIQSPLFFDRSFIDSAGLLYSSDIDEYNQIRNTHLINRYNRNVFITPPWKEIYKNDAERDQTFDQAIGVYEQVCRLYRLNDYEIILLPRESIAARADFILKRVSSK